MEYEQPIEDFMQYTNKNGVNFVASKPKNLDLEPWFDDMIERYGLKTLTSMFPYVTLVVDKETGMLKTWKPCSYNARVTNAFHVLLAEELDKQNEETIKEEYDINLERHFPKQDKKIDRNIGFDTANIIAKDTDGYTIDCENMPEFVTVKAIPKGWHPNRDANGNYKSAKQQLYPIYGYYNNYSYLPQYQTFTQYPR